MNLTPKKEATKPASFNFLQQQGRFDTFQQVYNNERPHQALGGQYPAEVFTPSVRPYTPAEEPEYPYHDKTRQDSEGYQVWSYLHGAAQDQPEHRVCRSDVRHTRSRRHNLACQLYGV